MLLLAPFGRSAAITFEDSDIYHEILFCFGNPFKKNYMYMKI